MNNQFKVEDFRTGMKVLVKNGMEYIILLNCEHGYTAFNTKKVNIAVNPNKGTYLWTSLEHIAEAVVEVFVPNHPYDIFYVHDGWKSIWKREEKTEQEKKIEQLEATIAKASEEIKQLKAMK